MKTVHYTMFCLTEAGRRRLLFGTVQQYNGLPPEVRSMSLGRFKRSVSDLLLG